MNREEESRRILKRLNEQSEKTINTPAPTGDDQDDHIERLGRRIARILGYALGGLLIYWLWRQLGG
jgi:hypothetical protein